MNIAIQKEIHQRLIQFNRFNSRHEKIEEAGKLFTFLASNPVKNFLNTHKKLKDTVARKLIEFRYMDGIKDAVDWWKAIFEHDMPLLNHLDLYI